MYYQESIGRQNLQKQRKVESIYFADENFCGLIKKLENTDSACPLC